VGGSEPKVVFGAVPTQNLNGNALLF